MKLDIQTEREPTPAPFFLPQNPQLNQSLAQTEQLCSGDASNFKKCVQRGAEGCTRPLVNESATFHHLRRRLSHVSLGLVTPCKGRFAVLGFGKNSLVLLSCKFFFLLGFFEGISFCLPNCQDEKVVQLLKKGITFLFKLSTQLAEILIVGGFFFFFYKKTNLR